MVCASLLVAVAQQTNLQEDSPNARYWKKAHAEDELRIKQALEQQQAKRNREAVQETLRLAEQQHAKVIIESLPPPPKINFIERHRDYFLLGLAVSLWSIVTVRTLMRHRAEAEIRALVGGYLSDGTAVASFKMPDLFAPAPERELNTDSAKSGHQAGEGAQILEAKLEEFFAQAPTFLAALRKALQALGRVGNEAEWHQALAELPQHVTALREKANFWAVRPVWQLCSALELLVKRVAEKPKDATPSTLRTVSAAVDMLHTLCVPGIRANLAIDPPIRILAADDDPLCLRAVVFALQKASLVPDVAENGQLAVALAEKNTYDVIFMDIQMPQMDGLTACEKIHETSLNAGTPVVFVTVQSDFHTRAQSNLLGATDFMAKPFLVFELTVKALMFVMRKRLGLAQSKAAVASPVTAAAPIPKSPEAVVTGDSGSMQAVSPILSVNQQPETPRTLADAKPDDHTPTPKLPRIGDPNCDFFVDAPEYLATMHNILHSVTVGPDHVTQQLNLSAMLTWIQTLNNLAKAGGLPGTARLGGALEALIKRLHQNPKTVTASTLNTVSKSLSLLESLCVRGAEEKLSADSPVKILVVEDEPLSRRAVVGALQLAFEKPDSAEDGAKAFALASQKSYDVIFSDVEMPGMSGFELCAQLRSDGPNHTTPLVFITTHSSEASRRQAVECGGTDFISKPFFPIEIAVKALTYAWDNRLQQTRGSIGKTAIPSNWETVPDVPAGRLLPAARAAA